MMVAIMGMVSRFATALQIGAGVVVGVTVTALAMLAYDTFIDDPRVAREARREYVAAAELAAVKAELAKVKREKEATQKVLTDFEARYREAMEQQAEHQFHLEQEIAEYEARLAESDRVCVLDDRDIEWLSKP